MAVELWASIAILVGAMFGLCLVFIILSSRKMGSLKTKSVPEPMPVIYGPKLADARPPDSEWDAIEKSRGSGTAVIPLILKTVVGFYDTIYIGDSYSLKVYVFNTMKNAENQEAIISGLMAKDSQKKFATDTLYAKDQDPVEVKIEIFAPNFNIFPPSRVIKVPAGATGTSTHAVSIINEDLDDFVIGQTQTILVSFDQLLAEGDVIEQLHLGSLDYSVKIEKSIIPIEIESKLTSEEKIKYISTAAGVVTAILTVVAAILATI